MIKRVRVTRHAATPPPPPPGCGIANAHVDLVSLISQPQKSCLFWLRSRRSLPERLSLLVRRVRSVACSDRMTAAITSDGALYTWGDGAPGNLGYAQPARQFVPRRVAGGLAGQHATQVSRSGS